jgi:hypothetical protein
VNTPTTPAKADVTKPDELFALVKRAEDGDETALPAVKDLLNRPGAIDLLGGNLARLARQTLIGKFSGKNLVFKEALNRQVEQLQAEVAGPAPTPLERLLAERVAVCWLHLHHLEQLYSQKESMTIELGAYYQRCISAAHKRYLAAIKTLAVVRKLAVPILQVNIAKKQVNIAGPATADDHATEGRPRQYVSTVDLRLRDTAARGRRGAAACRRQTRTPGHKRYCPAADDARERHRTPPFYPAGLKDVLADQQRRASADRQMPPASLMALNTSLAIVR